MKKRILITLTLCLALIFSMAALVIGVSASESEPTLEVKQGALSLEESIKMLFRIEYENVDNPEDVELLIWVGDGVYVPDCKKGNEHYSLKNAVIDVQTGAIVFTFDELAAAEMTKNVYAMLYYNGTYSQPYKYSILQYAYNKLGITKESNATPELKNVLLEMLAYGAAAQQYFTDEDTGALATDTFKKLTVVGGELPDGMTEGLYPVGSTVTLTAKPTAELPYVIWTNELGQTVSAEATYNHVIGSEHETVYATLTAEKSSFGMYKYVVVVGVDGAGDFMLETANTPNLDRIFGTDGTAVEGAAYTETMFINAPTSSGPSWTSHLHGVNPEHHGVNENNGVEEADASWTNSTYPSFLKLVRDKYPEERVGALYSWCGINGMIEADANIDELNTNNDDVVLMNYITGTYLNPEKNEKAPKALFIHLHEPDSAGHNYGYYTSEQYVDALEESDANIGRIYDAYEALGILDETLFMITVDHGGERRTHGGMSDGEQYVFFAAKGHTVDSGANEIVNVENRDTASIALYALGIPQPASYTGTIPAGLFEGVSAKVRPVYHDPSNPRDPRPVPTPVFNSNGSVTNYVNKTLDTYITFDGNATATVGGSTNENGIVHYVDGIYGQAVNLDRGSISVGDFAPGKDSFTITFWMKTPAHHGSAPILSNGNAGTTNAGFHYYAERETAGGIDYTTYYNIGNDQAGSRIISHLDPDEVVKGWTHVTLVMDRINNEMRIAYDFGEFTAKEIVADRPSSTPLSDVDLTTVYDLIIGDDAFDPEGSNNYKIGLTVDEFMIWDGAFTRNDLNDLVEYYGRESTVPDENTVVDIFENEDQPDIYFDFNGDWNQGGKNPSKITEVGTSTFVEGFDGTENGAIYFPDGKNYATLNDFKLGTDSFSYSFWINLQDITSGRTAGDRWIFGILSSSTTDNREGWGMNVAINNENDYLVINLGDGSSENWANCQNAKDGVQYLYKIPAELYEKKWTHITISVNRDVTFGALEVYLDFVKTPEYSSKKLTNKLVCAHNTPFPDDASLDGNPLTIGQYATAPTKTPIVYMDDLMIFKRAVTDADVAKLAEYYHKPLSDYLGENLPEIYLNFNNTVENTGTSDAEAVAKNNVTYTNGIVGNSATLGEGYVQVPEYKFGTDSFSVSMWLKSSDFSFTKVTGNDDETMPLITTAETYGGEPDGFALIWYSHSSAGNRLMLRMDNGLEEGKKYSDERVQLAYIPDLTTSAIQDNEWFNLTVVIDRTKGAEKWSVYINFELVHSEALTLNYYPSRNFPSDIDVDGSPLTIGNYGNGSHPRDYTGEMDEVMVFRGALSDTDIAKLAEYYSQPQYILNY